MKRLRKAERMTVFESLIDVKSRRGGGFLLLVDPDRLPERKMLRLSEQAEKCEVDAILIGSSFVISSNFHCIVKEVKEHTNLPVIVFPGSHSQISRHADAILFSSLISGRNPQYLIDEQVKGAPLVKEYGLETIPTAYILIDSGNQTSVQFISNTQPIPADKADIACAHALAAQYLGMKLIYLEAGSSALNSVPEKLISAVADYISLPLVVGGGIRTPDEAEKKILAGASFVVVGSQFEKDDDMVLLREFASAAHPLEKVAI